MDAPSLSTAAHYGVYFIVLLGLWVGCYCLLFDPLRNYPGPFLARLTDAYAAWLAFRKDLHIVTHENFQKYGPVVRQGPNRLVFNTVAALYDIYPNSKVTKGQAYFASHLTRPFTSVFNTVDRVQHRRKRRLIGEALTDRSMRLFEPTMKAEIGVFLRKIIDSWRSESAIDMTPACQRLGVDVVGMLAFGYPLRTQTEERFRFLQTAMDGTVWRINMYMQLPVLALLEPLLKFIGQKQFIKFTKAVQHMTETRTAQPSDARHDLYKVLAKQICGGPDDISEPEIWSEAMFFIIAGGNTTATTMCALFFYLSRNQVAYDTLAAEIRSTFADDSEICGGPKLSSCKYLRACIDETLRMSVPSISTLWREQDVSVTEANEPFVVDGHNIPRRTQVGVNLYALLHNEEYFPDPFTWQPARWLDDGVPHDEVKTTARATMQKAFVPFIIGDRACAGRTMAYLEASLTVARTMWFFDFERAPGAAGDVGAGTPGRTDGRHRPGEYQLYDVFVAEHHGPNLVFHPRDEYWKELEAGN